MIHISDISSALRCERRTWNAKHLEQTGIPEAHSFKIVSFPTLWESYLDIPEGCEGFAWETTEHSLGILEEYGVGVHLRFEYQDCRTKIPCLKKNETGWTAIYPTLSPSARDHDLMTMALNSLMLEKLGVKITDHKMLILNSSYVRHGDLIPEEILIETRHFNSRGSGFKMATIQEMVEEAKKDLDLDALIASTSAMLEKETPPEAVRTRQCTAPRKCSWYASCFEEEDLKEDDALQLSSASRKMELSAPGLKLKDIPAEMIDGFDIQYAQIMADRNAGVYIDKSGVKTWLDNLEWPLCYLDFEWDTFAFPPYDGMRPFDVLCFEYSLHIQHQDGLLEHLSFFGAQDCRRKFIESLIEDMPEKGSIVVYNMEGAEKLRLNQLAEQFPEYGEQLHEMTERMVDLAALFDKGLYYDLRQKGHFSLKTMLPLFSSDTGYSQLDISDGMQAVEAYRKMSHVSEEEQEKIAEAIDTYCSMDTYAEVIIVDGLRKKAAEE